MKRKKWTVEELNIMREFYPKEKTLIKKRLPGRTVAQICGKARVLGLSKPQHRYSYDEDKTICEKILMNGGYNLSLVKKTADEFKLKGYKYRSLNSYLNRFSNFNYIINGYGYYGYSKQCMQVYKDLISNKVA